MGLKGKGKGIVVKKDEKTFNYTISALSVDDASAPVCIFTPIRGSDDGKRIAKKTAILNIFTRFELRSKLLLEACASDRKITSNIARVIFYVHKAANNTQATASQLLLSSSLTNACSFYNISGLRQHRVISDRSYLLACGMVQNANANTDYMFFEEGGNHSYQIKQYMNLLKTREGPIWTKYSANNGTIADIVSGALYLLVIGSVATGTNQSGQANGFVTMGYTD